MCDEFDFFPGSLFCLVACASHTVEAYKKSNRMGLNGFTSADEH
jgi:hypothetical protein